MDLPEEELRRARESEARFRTVAETSLVGVYMVIDGRLAYVNPSFERTLGYESGELVGADPLALCHPDDRPLAEENFRRRYEGEARDVRYEVRAIRKDGGLIVVEIFGTSVEIDGRVAIVGNLIDITDRKRAEESVHESEIRLRHAQKMEAVGLLAGGIAHDFNNILAVIMGSTAILMSETGPRSAGYPALEEIQGAAERAAALTKQLLAFGRRQEMRLRTLDLNVTVAETATMLRRMIGEDIELTTASSDAPALVVVDPSQIEQVLMNLAVNAREAMPRGGKLSIEVGREDLGATEASKLGLEPGHHVTLRVADNGVGMDAELQERIFEPYFTTKELGKGTGLGLATVFGIVEQSKGQITVESQPGRGATFRIWLPLAAEASLSAPPQPPAMTDDELRGTETVLLVEDDEAVRRVARAILTKNGYQVLVAHGGGDALLLCEQYPGPIDLVLTDVVMHLIRGDELVARLTRLRHGIKVVYMSGYADRGGGLADLGSTNVFVEKPFTPRKLLRAVRESLSRRESTSPERVVVRRGSAKA